jgi:hypothetical protein
MSDIRNQLIKDSYNYVLQSDLTTGIVYRIGGEIPVNPIFSSGLTITGTLKYQDGSESYGYVLTSDSNGNASWKPISGGTGGTTVTGGTFDSSTKVLTLYNSDNSNVIVTGFTDTFISGGTISGTSIVFSFNDGNSFTLTGITPLSLFESYTSTTENKLSDKVNKNGDTMTGTLYVPTISAMTYLNLPPDVYLTSGVYNDSTGIVTFTNSTGGTFDVSGFFKISDDTYVTGGTYTNGNIIFRNSQGDSFGVTGLPIGGAGGQVYYLNLSQNQNGYQEFSPIPTTQPEQTTGVTINALSTETIASFLTPIGYPSTNLIPSGVWSFYLHSYKDSSSAEIDIFCEIYLRNTGGTETFLLSTDPTPITSNSPTPTMEITDGYYSGRTISVDDRILVKIRATNNKNNIHTLTFLTEGNIHYSYGVTPFSNNTQFTCDDITGCTVINDILVSLDDKIQYYYQNTAPTGTIVVGSIWQHSETGVEYTYNYDGNSYQWVQQTLPVGPQGPQGINGTNNIDSGTTTTFNGILVGDGVTVSSSTITGLIGYTPENVANKETSALDNSNTKYPTNNVVNTALQSFSDDVDYATMINQRILFNY